MDEPTQGLRALTADELRSVFPPQFFMQARQTPEQMAEESKRMMNVWPLVAPPSSGVSRSRWRQFIDHLSRRIV